MDFVNRERIGSIQAVEDMAATVKAVYLAALKHDQLPEETTCAVFSDDNPFVVFLDRAWTQYREMVASCAAHGYTGLSMNSRDVYKRRRARRCTA